MEDVRLLTDQFRKLNTKQLRGSAAELKQAVSFAAGNDTSRHLAAAFGLMTEAVRRTTGMSFYDVQLLGGLSLARGEIAQMQTGEGKTLTTALPAFFFSLRDQGTHVATTNAYLAQRDSEQLRPAFELLGVSVGLLPDDHAQTLKYEAYRCGVTFGTGYEFGFDFLRDQVALRQQPKLGLGVRHLTRLAGRLTDQPRLLQRPQAFAVIDEADSVLVDEATMPLILSGLAASNDDNVAAAEFARKVSDRLQPDVHYALNESVQSIRFTEAGWTALHEPLHTAPPSDLRHPWVNYVEQALRARHFLQRDVDYVVRGGKVQIVDQHTGRIHEERSWRDGLHQAVETHEGLTVSPERTVDGRVSRQRYFQFYRQICGMTGTATGSEREFRELYGLKVREIPTHRPCLRQTLQPRVFGSDEARDTKITEDVQERRSAGQPVLVGTRTIRHSQQLSARFAAAGIPHAVLNGVQDEEEAAVIGRAGVSGTITIATNMAGRGTDIQPDEVSLRCGGLHVIAAEHNASRRVDRQLSGRAARQGNPGSVRFYVSASDELFTIAESHLPKFIRKHADRDGQARVDLAADIAAMQDKLEKRSFQRRREMVRRDRWMESILDTMARLA